MTEPIAPAQPPDETATLLAAGLASERSSSRWQPPGLGELQDGFPNLEIISLLGSGGMGAVYLARQRHLDRRVALKLLNPARAGDPQFDERFTREARALARLDHPNIIRIHDFGRTAGRAFLLMEYIEGSNLRQVMATGALSGAEALRLVGQLCDALAHAHAAGVVHRDLKPENIMIDGRGDAHIADFGLAKIAEAGPSLTGTGEVLGTLHYMAPEQLSAAGNTDHRVDLYALGVITYEMLTGSLPLGRFDPPSHRSAIGPALDFVVLRSLEPDPSRRYSSAVDLGEALAQAGSAQRTRTPPPAAAPGSAPEVSATKAAAAQPPGGGGAAEEPTRIPEVEPPPSFASTSKVRLSWDGLHVQDGKDTVRIGPGGIHVEDGEEEVHIGLGGIHVRERKEGGVGKNVQVQFGQHAEAHGLASGDGSSSCYAAGMMAIFLGSLLAIGFANGRLFDFLADPTAHFAAHRVGDLAMLAVPAYLAGGIALDLTLLPADGDHRRHRRADAGALAVAGAQPAVLADAHPADLVVPDHLPLQAPTRAHGLAGLARTSPAPGLGAADRARRPGGAVHALDGEHQLGPVRAGIPAADPSRPARPRRPTSAPAALRHAAPPRRNSSSARTARMRRSGSRPACPTPHSA